MRKFQEVVNTFRHLKESDAELRALERAYLENPSDQKIKRDLTISRKRAGLGRHPQELKDAAHKSRARSLVLQRMPQSYSNNYKKWLRNASSDLRATYRAHELRARAEENNRQEIAAGRTRKLLKVLSKHAKKIEDPYRTDNKYRRIEHLANRAADQFSDLKNNRRLGHSFGISQDPERVGLPSLSSRTRREHNLPSWKTGR